MLNQSLKIGDKIIDSDQIHVVSKIENDIVFYHPLEKDERNSVVVSSIPLNNFKKAGLRVLSTKDDIKDFLKLLKKQEPLEVPAYSNKNNNNNLKEYLYLNDPLKTGQLLIYLNERQKTPLYSKADQIIFDQALDHLSVEISMVNKIPITDAKKQLLSAIKRN